MVSDANGDISNTAKALQRDVEVAATSTGRSGDAPDPQAQTMHRSVIVMSIATDMRACLDPDLE